MSTQIRQKMEQEGPIKSERLDPDNPAPDEPVEDSGPERYQYHALGNDEFRLVRLHTQTRSIHSNEALCPTPRVEIVQSSLTASAPLNYEAVSYTWGSSIQSQSLETVCGSLIAVSPDLLQILDAILKQSSSVGRLLWIDQLCIDQMNSTERSQQISLVRQIYASAVQVLVCVGDTRHLFEMSDARVLDVESIHSRRLLAAMLELKVFSRAWVYQEIVSGRAVKILGNHITGGGQLEVEWVNLVRSFKNAILFEAAMRVEKIVSSSPGIGRINLIVNDREQLERFGHKDWMLLLTQAQEVLECADPRDHVLALTTFQGFFSEIPNAYRMPTLTLYRITTCTMIDVSHTLDIFAALSGRWHSPHFDDMPSWVPDFSQPTRLRPFYLPLQPTGFNAAADYPHKMIDTQDKRRLRVMGHRVDKICYYLEHQFEERESATDVRFILSVPWHHRMYLSKAESDGDPIPQSDQHGVFLALLSAMTAGFSSSTSFTEDTILGRPPECWYEDMYDICAYQDMILEGTYEPRGIRTFPTDSLIPTLGQMYGSWKNALSRLSFWAGICSGRRIVFGEKEPGRKRTIGLVPRAAKGEDSVWILHGAKVPVVLRRLGRCYRVIGQCYWDGCMYGEKVSWEENAGQAIDLV